MALGRKEPDRQEPLWTATHKIARSEGHPFYRALNRMLARADFDRWVEALCEPYYAERTGRPGIPPGVYFRMLFVGYFEGIESQRGIAWRCADSLSIREFLGVPLSENTPDHSTLTRIRQRLPMSVYEKVFAFVLRMADGAGLVEGKTIAVDSTMLEANAAMKSIVRREGGGDWDAYVRCLMAAEGIEEPTDEDVRRYDRGRKDKKVSNKDWESPSDPDSRIARMKDGRTHLAYKASHAVDLDTEVIVEADVLAADRGDADSLEGQVEQAEENLHKAGCAGTVREVVADKGYHKAAVLERVAERGTRTYIPERRSRRRRRWKGKPPPRQKACNANRRRTKGTRGRSLQRRRSEKVERSFAHTCETGGGRRATLRGLEPNRKRHKILAAAHNLGRIMREEFGVGKPRALQGRLGALWKLILSLLLWILGPKSAPPRRTAPVA